MQSTSTDTVQVYSKLLKLLQVIKILFQLSSQFILPFNQEAGEVSDALRKTGKDEESDEVRCDASDVMACDVKSVERLGAARRCKSKGLNAQPLFIGGVACRVR